MKLIIKLSLVALSLASLAGCSKQAQPKPPNKEITTVKVINQPVSLKKKNIVLKVMKSANVDTESKSG